uniref:THAP-type domain-containing protein n=1 Tax=Cebus imitator TaxID=2715852 RepID=A0A2K5Q115_CEBIM
PNCTRKSTQSYLAFFRFPTDLEYKTPDQLNKHYRLCAKHFETSMICRTDSLQDNAVLRDNAIPTIFDLTSHLNNPHSRHRKRIKELKGGEEQDEDILPLTLEGKENKEYLKSLSEILILVGKQNMLLDGHGGDEIPEGLLNSGEEVLRKCFDTTAVNTLFCSKTQQSQMLATCESCIRKETLREMRDSHFFSIITDDVVDIAGEGPLAVLVRFVDESHNLREKFVGSLPYEADAETLAVRFHTVVTEKWGLNMEYFCGQAYIVSSGFSSKMKVVASRLLEKYPQAVYTLSSSCALNMWLAKSLPVMGISIALETLRKVKRKERGKELKEICASQWAGRHNAFEILGELLQVLVLCLDRINSDTNTRWNNSFVLCSEVTDFDFIVTIVGLKNVLSFTRAFGINLQGIAVLNKVMENIEVCHEFWFEEATTLANKLDLQMKLPGKFCRVHQGNLESQLTSESYCKETLSVPAVEHIIQKLKETFSEQHSKALKCLSLAPSVMGQLKFNTSEGHHADMCRSNLPNPDMLSLPFTIYEVPQLPDVKLFSNVYALLKVLCILLVMKVENQWYKNGQKHLKAYLRNTLTDQSSSNRLLNIDFDIKHDLDLMADIYFKLYASKSELSKDNSETMENT